MGRYIGPKNKIARRFGVNLGLKTNPSKVAKRLAQMPGVHGPSKKKGATSSYGKQLNEKQKAKYVYGLRERQFRSYVEEAIRQEGDSGLNLQRLLEKRLDNVVYRAGFAVTRAQARQMVGHNMFTLNGKKMNIPSHLVKVGDVIAIKETKIAKKIFEKITETLEKANLPSWISVDSKGKSAKVTNQPAEADFDKVFDVTLIIEYYSQR
ncbi:MAG: 30S ribosomal protein S4 [Candidatus Magasanikbacteria bacterium RIFCSPHIGHO2_01_FULL_33_34]|uniref:Small ribosomal subunit protein uS4 n=1 Tax=Candidatus Magasanikbacteria bacterium RIFCSPHIGHO2_01_FULL_33_34 TaxID=1798671 RepID=A0A1F6LL34_9BACT|nr:MAG: 30S ribosomal protein S4 [Candidatus Magasanikbacteria bacterium RIFCSPHIGHO2_01_FULL_33_34]OGH65823.1 MAG: 30S ribosomal protein S4 [Candidatus Magasanikbacteria bacterium RIFCSPHIGHO2_02_FULL_33_17]OGH75188.1 MAG: 30S ribosomal protein S4 [Candidatus Magasanikbacteria bacterium RIFCSPLOWO2_01_FULL_33_34]OGH82530.1 MAG: 30S ribosomal protein S4 [Candidatus Magasanikbacteria bacterium RIFCSPLOWO2_12_FULL_34_7]